MPGADETGSLGKAWLANWTAEVIEAVAKIAHEPVPRTDDLSTREGLERAWSRMAVPVCVYASQPLRVGLLRAGWFRNDGHPQDVL